MNRLWLTLDCNYLCHRAKYVFGELSYKGSVTGVIYGVLKDIESLQEEFQTKYIIFCFDYGKSKRTRLCETYKSNRKRKDFTEEELEFEIAFKEQVKKLRTEYLRTMGFRNIFYQKNYEADDVIASVCQNLPKRDEAVIVSADHDLYQLLSDRVSIYHPQKKHLITNKTFFETYKITPKDWVDVKALAGCTTDNIKGIDGVGEKTAIKFLTQQLKKESKIYQKILNEMDDAYQRNLPIVTLPLIGTEIFKLKRDKKSFTGYNSIIKQLGFKSMMKGQQR